MITSGLVNVFTDDIEAALAFYRDVLGLPETFRTPREGEPEHVELAAGGFVLALSTAQAARRVHGIDVAVGAPSVSIVLWVERADEVDSTFATVTGAGATAVSEPHDAGDTHRNAAVRGPDGIIVELVGRHG